MVNCEYHDRFTRILVDLPTPAPPAIESPGMDSQRPCPMCGAVIGTDAKKCLCCGESIAQALPKTHVMRVVAVASTILITVFFAAIGALLGSAINLLILWLTLNPFNDGSPDRAQRLNAWCAPGQLVGFALGGWGGFLICRRLFLNNQGAARPAKLQ
jgi:hypothetical protein